MPRDAKSLAAQRGEASCELPTVFRFKTLGVLARGVLLLLLLLLLRGTPGKATTILNDTCRNSRQLGTILFHSHMHMV